MRFTIPELRITKETVENCIGLSTLLLFTLFYLVPSWRSPMRDVLAGLGLVFFAFGIPYLLSQAARTRRQRAALMFLAWVLPCFSS